jgi:hypothetical protein
MGGMQIKMCRYEVDTMKLFSGIRILVLVGAMGSFSAGCQDSVTTEMGLRYLLPQRVDDWIPQGEVLEYAGDELFDYINGGAEIYYEYGFSRVIVQDYKTPDEHTLSLEIYEMEDPESAFGIYSFKRSPGGENIEVGDQGRLEDYYLNFWKGKYHVTLTGFDQEPLTIQGLQHLAAAVAERIQERGGLPALVDLLPSGNRVEAGLTYFEGQLSLYNSFPFAQENIFLLEKGLRIDYTSGSSLFLFKYMDAGKTGEAWERSRTFFAGSDRYSGFTEYSPQRIGVTDSEGRFLVIATYRNFIIVALSAADLVQAEVTLKDILARLKAL